MEIKITSKQEAALNRSNESANTDPTTRPALAEFVQSMFDEKMNDHVRAWEQRDNQIMAATLATNIATMTKEDKATVTAILDKYKIPAPAEVAPIGDVELVVP